jgi:GNAT superfamily N-acetyltransferase
MRVRVTEGFMCGLQPYNESFPITRRSHSAMLTIRPVLRDDISSLLTLVRELADYEHLTVVTTESDLLRDGFGPQPKFRALVAELDGKAAGYAMFYDFYSSFQGRCGLFLEDLFVRPKFRGKGIGKALLARVAAIAQEEDYFCMQWEVLDWNQPAIDFYERLGAVFMDEWRLVALKGNALQQVAGGKS